MDKMQNTSVSGWVSSVSDPCISLLLKLCCLFEATEALIGFVKRNEFDLRQEIMNL